MQRQPLLRVDDVSKSYYRIHALKNITCDIYEGEIVGLLGANGAGKSTLLKIVGGVERADSGHIHLQGESIDGIDPHTAYTKGIASVYQELNLFQNLTVSENLFIGREYRTSLKTIDWKESRRQAKEVLESSGLKVTLDAEVLSLSLAQQLMLEIVRALHTHPKVLLLDEPTSALSEKEIEWLFTTIRDRAQKGTTIVYVSHRLDEVTELCQRCLILRDGNLVSSLDGTFDKTTIINNMIGHDVVLQRGESETNTNPTIFECANVYQDDRVKDVSFTCKKGEILGIAGLVGAGRTELLRTLFGIDRMTSGEVWVHGKKVRIRNPKDAMSHGIAFVPEDRKVEGLFLEETVRFNIASATMDRRKVAGIIKEGEEKRAVKQAAESVQVDTSRIEDFAKLLSGGNQQKSVIAKTLLVNADVMLLDEPTRGVDIGAREEIYELIKGFASAGKAIVLVSSDWDELFYLVDRMVVMSEGRVTGVLDARETNEEELLHLATIADVRKDVVSDGQDPEAAGDNTQNGQPSEPRRTGRGAGLPAYSVGRAVGFMRNLVSQFRRNNNATLISIVVALLVLGAILEPALISWYNIRSMMGQMMPILLLTIGQFVVVICGGLDLSSGAMLAASSVLGMNIMLLNPPGVVLGVAIMLLFGLVVGAINGLLVVKGRVDPFVTTLGMSIILTGVTLIVTKNPIGPSPRVFRQIVTGTMGGIPYVLLILVAVIAVFTVILRYTPLGRQFYAVGENSKGAHWAGLPVQKTQMIAYMIGSMMAVLASIFMLGRTGAADPALGPGMEIIAIAAALIGGAVLGGGGRGTLTGAVLAVVMLAFLENILNFEDVELWYQEIIEGVLLLGIIISYEVNIGRSR